jgi:hypothetical protein
MTHLSVHSKTIFTLILHPLRQTVQGKNSPVAGVKRNADWLNHAKTAPCESSLLVFPQMFGELISHVGHQAAKLFSRIMWGRYSGDLMKHF